MDYPQFHMLYMSSKELSSLDASPSKGPVKLKKVVLLVIGLCRSCRHLAMFRAVLGSGVEGRTSGVEGLTGWR